MHHAFELCGHSIRVSDPDRRIDGNAGPSKADIFAYYINVAPRLLEFLRERPISTVWLPDVPASEFRFARHSPQRFAPRFPIYSPVSLGAPRGDPYLTVPDTETLAGLLQHGCLSFHPWNCRAAARLQPDRMVFNLDPEAIAFREVRNAALLLQVLLADCGLQSWVKTSGGNGLHVLVPVNGGVSFEDVGRGAEIIVSRAMQREPSLFSRDVRRARRRGRIMIDTSRNHRGETVIAPYAVATSGLVSALVESNELQRPLYPEDFDMPRVLAREHTDRRIQAAFFAVEQTLDVLLACKRRGGENGRAVPRAPGAPPRVRHTVQPVAPPA